MTAQGRIFATRELAGGQAYLSRVATLAGQVPDGAPDPSRIGIVGVLGAGTMGRGIAMGFAQSGRDVVVVDPDAQALVAAQTHITGLTNRALSKGRINDSDHAGLLARVQYRAKMADFAACDLVIEAVPEILALKTDVLRQIEQVVGPDALITSNTSTLDVDRIAAGLSDPGRFIGTHFFLPAHVNKLLELVPAAQTRPATEATMLALARDLGKRAVIAPNGDGFIGNRLFDRFHQEAMYLVEEGAWPEDVDAALERWGMTIGPFRALDMVGNDIPWGVRKQRAARAHPPPQPRIGDALCEAGLMGVKAGRGWYLYDAATPKGRPYETVRALILREVQSMGRTRRQISPQEIVGRCLTALMVEGLAMVHEGRAARPSDIDTVYVTGYGFPVSVGGPMRLLDDIGVQAVLDLARHYAQISGRADSAWAMPSVLTGLKPTQTCAIGGGS